MGMPIYLDYNGTTPIDPQVAAAMRPFLETEFGNPSSSHWYGIAPKKAVDTARRQVAEMLGVAPSQVIFTSGGTESNNHALCGIAAPAAARGAHIITSAVEHPAILEVCRYLETRGVTTTVVLVDGTGMVDPEAVRRAIRPETILISVMHANNEVGTIQPIAEIAAIAHEHGILMHTDAAQSIGKIPVTLDGLGVDLISVAGHKLYAPKGVGVLVTRADIHPKKFCHGAGQESGMRAGTENVMGIVGLGKACEIAARDLSRNMAHMRDMRERLYHRLHEALGAGIRLNGHPDHRLPNTLSVAFHHLEANRLLEEIGLTVAASAGAACHADTVNVSHVLEAMNVPLEWAKGTLRFSVGRPTTPDDIDAAAACVIQAAQKLSAAVGAG